MLHPNTKIKSLIQEFRHEFGDMSGSNVPLDALLLYHFLKTMTGVSGSASPTTASTVTVRGSTGSTLLTNAQGAILIGSPLATEATVSTLNAKIPSLTNNRLPVDVQFPATLATETTLSALNNKLPALVGDRLPVDVIFPPQQVDAQITGFSTEDTLLALLDRTPQPIQGKTPVVFDDAIIFKAEITNHQAGLASEQTLNNLLARIPNQVNSRLPVGVNFPDNQPVTILNQLSGYSTESTLSALLGRVPESIQGRLPVGVQFPTNQQVTVLNQLTGVSSEATLSSLLNRVPESINNRLPVNVLFPNNQVVTVSNPSTGFSTESTLSALLSRIPDLVSGRLPVGVSFPTDLAKDASTVANGTKLDQIVANTAGIMPRNTQAQYYASKAGGQRSFNATAGSVAIGSTATLATLFINPVGSGVDIYIQRLVLASLAAGSFGRYRGGSYTIGANAVAAKSVNRSKGSLAAMGKVYGTNVTATGGDLGVLHYNAANSSWADNVDGTIILPPGDFIFWMFQSASNSTTSTAIEVAWWELPAT